MRKLALTLVPLLLAILAITDCQADTIVFDLETTEQVTQGEAVFWSIFVTISDLDNDNFGIDTAATDLTDGGGHTLMPGTIGAPFDDYTFKEGGTPSGSSLIEIGATLLVQNDGAVEGKFGGDLGPLELASGSFIANNLGTFEMTMVAGTANSYFTGSGQFTGSGNSFEDVIFNGDSYTVLAVPEPVSTVPVVATLLYFALSRRRKRV
jgi:hypothetical protein